MYDESFHSGIRSRCWYNQMSPCKGNRMWRCLHKPAIFRIHFGRSMKIIMCLQNDPFQTNICLLLETNESFYLFCKVECTVVVSATRLHGYRPDKDYQITLMVEDFPDYTIKVGSEVRSIHNPISKIPLQVSLNPVITCISSSLWHHQSNKSFERCLIWSIC